MPDETELPRKAEAPRWLKPAGLIGIAAVVLLVAGVLVSRSLASQKVARWTAETAIPTVSLVAPTAASADQALTLPGDVQANYNAVIHARVSGYLKRWYVDIGAQVKAGQVLADIDTPDLDQQLARAKAQLATAQANQALAATTAARWTSLLSRDAVSRQEADEKTGDLAAKTTDTDAARAEVQQLQALESFKHIVAPFAGVITARNTDIGAPHRRWQSQRPWPLHRRRCARHAHLCACTAGLCGPGAAGPGRRHLRAGIPRQKLAGDGGEHLGRDRRPIRRPAGRTACGQ